jgi:hypothetical protein
LDDTFKRELENIDSLIKLLDKSLVNFLRHSHVMSESPSRWDLRTLALLVDHRLENSLHKLLIIHIEVDLETDFLLCALYSKAGVSISYPICDFSAFV